MFEWYGDNKLIIGFASGMISCVSTRSNELGQELASIKVSSSPIEAISVNNDLNKIAIGSGGTVKFYTMNDWQEVSSERIEISRSCGKMSHMHWTKDGSILTIATVSGYFLGFLTVIPSLYSAHEHYAALLSSLTEISVVDCLKNNLVVAKANLDVEPTFLHLGPIHFAVGINSSIWYYKWRNDLNNLNKPSKIIQLVCQRDYFGSIK